MTYKTYPTAEHRDLPETSSEGWKNQTMFADEDRDEHLEKLPERAKEKLITLRNEAEMQRAASRQPYDQARQAYEKMRAIESRIGELLRGGYRGYDEKHPHIIAERESLAKAKAEHARLTKLADERRPAADEAGRLVTHLHDYIKHSWPLLLTVTLAPDTPAPKPAKGESISDAIERTRAKIANLTTEIRAAADAPITSAEAKRIAKAHVDKMAERGRPNVLVTLEARLPPEFPRPYEQRYHEEIDIQSVFTWLHRDAMIDALNREIDQHAADDAALSDVDRVKRIEAFSRERLALERQEEALIRLARENYLPVARRADADPRAVLGLSEDAPAPSRDD